MDKNPDDLGERAEDATEAPGEGQGQGNADDANDDGQSERADK